MEKDKNKLLLGLTIALTAVTVALAIATAVLLGMFLGSGNLPKATLPLGIVALLVAIGGGVTLGILWKRWK